jgi:hypothetical protein
MRRIFTLLAFWVGLVSSVVSLIAFFTGKNSVKEFGLNGASPSVSVSSTPGSNYPLASANSHGLAGDTNYDMLVVSLFKAVGVVVLIFITLLFSILTIFCDIVFIALDGLFSSRGDFHPFKDLLLTSGNLTVDMWHIVWKRIAVEWFYAPAQGYSIMLAGLITVLTVAALVSRE